MLVQPRTKTLGIDQPSRAFSLGRGGVDSPTWPVLACRCVRTAHSEANYPTVA